MNKHHIPKCIWCFWDSKDLPDTVKISLDTWKHFNPDYKITVINKKNIKKLIPNINFDKIKIAKDSIQKYSDFIRICVLRKYGGIWIDGSSFSTCSFDEWFHKIGIKKTTDFIGYINPQFNKKKYEKKYPMIENWFFACPKNSKFVKEWHKEFMKLKNLNDVNDYINEVVEEGIDMQWIDNPQYLTQHLAAQAILQRGYNMKNMILLNAIQNKYGNGPLHYYISDKAWTLTDIESVRTLCKDKKEWSQPIVKLVGYTRRIIENNKSIKKCVFKIIEDLLKEKKDLGNKRTKRTKRNKKTRRIYKKKILRGGSANAPSQDEGGDDGAGTGLPNVKPDEDLFLSDEPPIDNEEYERNKKREKERKRKWAILKRRNVDHFPSCTSTFCDGFRPYHDSNQLNMKYPVFHLEMPGSRGKEFEGEWEVIKEGPIHSGEENFEDLLQISFKIPAVPWVGTDNSTLGSGSFGNVYMGTITGLEPIEEAEETPQIHGGLQRNKQYVIKLMSDERLKEKYSGRELAERLEKLPNEIKREFYLMMETYAKNSRLFLRPHLLLRKKYSFAIVMELGGTSLSKHILYRTKLNLNQLVGDLAVAIATIHSLGYVHNDLKLENIILVEEGSHHQLKVIDFGLANKTPDGTGNPITPEDNPLLCCADVGGTKFYMQPEYKDLPVKDTQGRAADWWAFGIIILSLVGYFGQLGPGTIYEGTQKMTEEDTFQRLREYFETFQSEERIDRILRECRLGYKGDKIKDLLKFALYFLDPNSLTRPFLRLEDDTITADFETTRGETAEKLQGLVDKLFTEIGR